MSRKQAVNTGSVAIDLSEVVSAHTAPIDLLLNIPGDAKLTMYTAGASIPPPSARGQLEITVGAAAGAFALVLYGPSGQSERLSIPAGGGTVTTAQEFSRLFGVSTDAAPGDEMDIVMLCVGVQRASDGDTGVRGVSVSFGNPGQPVYFVDRETVDVKAAPGATPSAGDQMVAGADGSVREQAGGDMGDVVGVSAANAVVAGKIRVKVAPRAA